MRWSAARRRRRPWCGTARGRFWSAGPSAPSARHCGNFCLIWYDKTLAGTLTSIALIFLSAIFTLPGWYQKLAAKAGAGTLVPITGFANSVVSPAIEFKAEGWVTGVGARIFGIAGPVIAFGTLASFVWGVLYWLLGKVG